MEAYAVPCFAVHRPDDLNWTDLPEECVVQLHWHRTPAFVHRLREEGFRVVCLTRHPLDVLISILQFCLYDDSTLQWLNGEGGSERPIQGAMPGSALFQEYGAGPRAAALMTVSREWASAPGCLRVRYEDLVADAQGELQRIAEALGEPSRRPIAEVVESATIPKLRVRINSAHHFWQGCPGLWRSLLIRPVVERFAEAHHGYCAELGYSCAADPLFAAAHADANWLALIWPNIAEKLRDHHLNRELAATRSRLRGLEGECAAAHDRLRGLGPTSLAIARWLAGLSHHLPGPASVVKRLLHVSKSENAAVR